MIWREVRLEQGAEPSPFYSALPYRTGEIELFHHFWDEPWWPGAYVIRVLSERHVELEGLPGVDHVAAWDEGPDEELFGETWPYVRKLFWLSSAISNTKDDRFTLKLVHCILNARGMSEWDEAKFAVRLFWNRLTIKPRLWWREQFS